MGALLILSLAAWSEPEAAPGAATVWPGQSMTADAMGFLNVRAVRGPDWQIRKFQGADGLWTARLEARGAVVTVFRECGDREDMMRFMLWPVNAQDPKLLFVLRNGGGVHGPDALEIIHLKENFRSLLALRTDFNFTKVEDLDHDSWPEVVGVSRRYAYLLDMGLAESPMPVLVFAYREDARQYLCQNQKFREIATQAAEDRRKAFEQSVAAESKFAFNKSSEPSRKAMADLLAWVVQTCIQGDEEAAWSYLDQFTAVETASLIRKAVEEKLATDPYYQTVKRTRKRDQAALSVGPRHTVVSQRDHRRGTRDEGIRGGMMVNARAE
jgi:hypothetical protein